MANTEECIFCNIARGKIPCAKVYETSKVLAFLDISPVNYGHCLVVPKKHYEKMQDLPDELLCEIVKTAKKIAPAIIKETNSDAYNLFSNNGKEAGQIVPHVHFHIIPRFSDDKLDTEWPKKKYNGGEIEKYAEKIKKNL